MTSRVAVQILRYALPVFLAVATAAAYGDTLEGFVTAVESGTSFQVGNVHVVTGEETTCSTSTLTSQIQLRDNSRIFSWSNHFVLHDRRNPEAIRVDCTKAPLRLGARVQVSGRSSGPNRRFLAEVLTVYDVQVEEDFATGLLSQRWQGGALLEEQPRVSRTGNDWTGSLWIDGYPMELSRDVRLLAAPRDTELSYRSFGLFSEPHWGAMLPKGTVPVFSQSLFRPNTWASYHSSGPCAGKIVGECGDGSDGRATDREQILLERIRLWPNSVSTREQRFVRQLTPRIHPPDYERRVPGTVGFEDESAKNSLKILPDLAVQHFVSQLGISLVPAFQKKIPDSDDTKIHFQFFAIEDEPPFSEDEMSEVNSLRLTSRRGLAKGVVAAPNGVVLVPGYLLAKIDNQAQLAFILSCAITTVIQKQSYISHNSRPGSTWGPEGQDLSWYLFPLARSKQTLRIGLRQMYLAGYDIREAPFAWAAAAGKLPTNPLPESRNAATQIPWETAYIFDLISHFYSYVNYGKLAHGDKEYLHFLDELRKADPHAFRPNH